MCQNATDRRKPAPPVHGTCRWESSDAREFLDAGHPAPLSITVQRKDGAFTTYYWLSPILGGGWLLAREGDNGERLESYVVSRDFWDCGCPAHQYSGSECKHIRAARVLLRKIGLAKE